MSKLSKIMLILVIAILLFFSLPACASSSTASNPTVSSYKSTLSAAYQSPIAFGDEVIVISDLGDVFSIGEYNSNHFFSQYKKAQKINSLSNIEQVFAFDDSYFAIDQSGDVWSWGDNTFGLLGLGNKEQYSNPEKITELKNVKNITQWNNNIVFILDDGTAQICGYDFSSKPEKLDTKYFESYSYGYFDSISSDFFTEIENIQYNALLKKDGSVYLLHIKFSSPAPAFFVENIPIDDKIISIYNYTNLTDYARAENGNIYMIAPADGDSNGACSIVLYDDVVSISKNGELFITDKGELISSAGEKIPTADYGNVIFVAGQTYGIAVTTSGEAFQFELSSTGAFMSYSWLDLDVKIKADFTINKNQYIGQNGRVAIKTCRDIWFQ